MNPQKRLVTPEDIWALIFVGDPQVHGNKVLYTLTTMNVEKNGYDTAIYQYSLDTGKEERFTTAVSSDKTIREHTARWSPSGNEVFFLSNRNGREQLFLIKPDGGEARQLSHVEDGISNPSWSPDATSIAFTMKEPKGEQDGPKNPDVRVIRRLRHKMNGVGFLDERRRHIYVLNVQSGELRQVTRGDFDVSTPVWSPCGSRFAFTTSTDADADLRFIPDVWTVDADGTNMKKLTQGLGPCASPVFSPCGQYLSYTGHEQGEKGYPDTRLYVLPLDGGERIDVTASFHTCLGNQVGSDARADRGTADPIWKEDSSGLYFVATDGGDANLYFASLSGEISAVTTGEQSITSYSVCGSRIAFTSNQVDNPGDIYLLDGEQYSRLTNVNAGPLAEMKLSMPERILYKGPLNWDVEGWLMKPTEYQDGEKYPLILHIHGGPHVAYGNAFFHEFQLLASQGYGVLYTNPRGSRGYGEEFTKAVVGDWGGNDYEDMMAGVEYCVKRYPWVDEARLGVTGGSYGGYMVNWMVSQTQRFKAAVTLRCISNMYTKYGTSDIGFYGNKAGMGGADLWEDEEFIMSRSPIRHAPKVRTPILIIQSEQDYRCPMEQAEQWFTALKRLGVTTEFVRFAGENHELSRSGKPRNRLDRLLFILDWFERYL
jgi:dipeptidyl aminopeptidase/acylaminoacyl peptidase